jgi:hypothetical protein
MMLQTLEDREQITELPDHKKIIYGFLDLLIRSRSSIPSEYARPLETDANNRPRAASTQSRPELNVNYTYAKTDRRKSYVRED